MEKPEGGRAETDRDDFCWLFWQIAASLFSLELLGPCCMELVEGILLAGSFLIDWLRLFSIRLGLIYLNFN